jgi:signal transduction histidine kinase
MAPDPSPGRRAGEVPHRVIVFLLTLLVASAVLPIVILTALSWRGYVDARADAEARARRILEVIDQHTLSVIETEDMVLDRVVAAASGMEPGDVRSSEAMSALLHKVNEAMAHMSSILVVDAKGDVVASSGQGLDSPNASDRDYFVAQRDRDAGTFIGTLHPRSPSGRPGFDLSRRISSADGAFEGIVAASVSPAYLEGFFASVDEGPGRVAEVVRADGEILVRDPPVADMQQLAAGDPLMRAIAASDQGIAWSISSDDGSQRLIGYRRVGSYPLYVAVAIDRAAALRPWYAKLMFDASVLIPSAFLLALVTLLALHGARQQNAALAQLAAETRERMTVEARLRQAQKMEALGELTSGLAHDFNNLLTAIRIYVDVIHGALTDAKVRKFADAMVTEIERAGNLIRSLLTLARHRPQEMQAFDVNATIRGMESLLQQSVGPGIDIAFDLAPDLWWVRADVNQADVALLNLAINARDAMPSGVVRMATANVELAGEPDGLAGRYVAISVTDTGTGMSRETVARAFEPFFTTKAPEKGTGLGLSSVRAFARQSNGAVVIASKPGEGTTVTIYLPSS